LPRSQRATLLSGETIAAFIDRERLFAIDQGVARLPALVGGELLLSELPAPELIEACPSIAISTGSACTSATVEPSYVLRALGLSDDLANASIRFGLGRFTTAAEVDFAADALADATARLRDTHKMAEAAHAPT